MEIAILGAVGLLGYTLSSNGKDARFEARDSPVLKNKQAYPWGPGTTVQAELDADRQASQARWEQAQRPHMTGVITPNTKPGDRLPFFTSAAKQNTNDAVKQRRMETFTGALDAGTSQTGTYSRKKEVPSMFKPEWTAGKVSSSGTTGSTAFGIDQASRFIPSMRQNNVLPTQQIRVGKGIGVGPDTAASDGFHPMLRIMPTNVGDYKKNNLPGVVVPGGSAVALRPMQAQLLQTGPPRFYDMERYPLGPGKAALNALTVRTEDPGTGCAGRGRILSDEYYGGATLYGAQSNGAQPSRNRNDNNPNMHETNVTGASHGIGGFVNSDFDMSRVEAQRREQAVQYEGMLTGAKAPKSEEMYLLPDTHRSIHRTEVMGNPSTAVEGGKARPQDQVDRTLREHLHPESQPGIAAPYLKGHSVQSTHKWMDREAKRYGHHMVNWMPPAHKATDVRFPGLVQVKPRLQLPEATVLPTTATPIGMAPVGVSTTTYNKLPPTNTRLDLAIAKNQLASNELAVALP